MAATYDVVIIGEVPLDPLWHSTPTFPPVSELWLRIQEAYGFYPHTWFNKTKAGGGCTRRTCA